ncbi:retinol dehydrogenase 11 [Aethina tumida]|uniref:retinol dehydrogenase 11 n=1 Tax=Aethina tumida TaxID=116153 RepID=UPI00096B34B9|nr:retinol dehydrogenase 11 [Aethina tumida]
MQIPSVPFKGYYLPHILTSVVVLYLIRKYRERKWGKCMNTVQLYGKIAIVTGANSGIGYEIAKELARRHAMVILACRDIDKAKEAIARIKESTKTMTVLLPIELDLASLWSIKEFAKKIRENYPYIDLLVNNAGVAFPPKKRVTTKDGLEVHFGVNHLGHYYLTRLLTENLINSRVVIVSSALHEKGQINLNDLNSSLSSERQNLYANSKLANIYFCQQLAKKEKLKAYACCPGWVYTKLFRHSLKWYHFFIMGPLAFLYMRTPFQGSQTPIYCCTAPELEAETGLLYRDCQIYNSKYKFDDEVGRQLWEQSELTIKEIMGGDSEL